MRLVTVGPYWVIVQVGSSPAANGLTLDPTHMPNRFDLNHGSGHEGSGQGLNRFMAVLTRTAATLLGTEETGHPAC